MFVRQSDGVLQIPVENYWKTSKEHSAKSYWWPSVDSKGKASSAAKNVMLMFPGNPGILEYYIEFLTRIYELTQKKVEIILVGHLGQPSDESSTTSAKIFGLQDQLLYKLDCVDDIVKAYSADINFFLVGHSVGAWLCEQVVKNRPEIKFTQVFLLFPALSKIRESSKGSWMSKYVFPRACREIVVFLVWLFASLPAGIRMNLISFLTQQKDHSLRVITEDFMKPININNCLTMANDEMEQICNLDVDFYKENLHKFTFYYGINDVWVPEECYYEMKDHFPQANVILCNENIPHSFVLGYSHLMSKKLASWLEKYL